MKKLYFIMPLFALFLLTLTGCTAQAEQPIQGGSITNVTLNETSAGQNANFTIPINEAQEDIGLDFWGAFTQGEVSIQVKNKSTQEIVYEKPFSGTSANFNEVITLESGEYDLVVTWDGSVTGTYNLEWQPGKVEIPKISPVVLLSGIGMLIVGFFFLFYGIRVGGKKYALFGSLFWLGTVIIKFLIAGLFNASLYSVISNTFPGLLGTIIFSIYVGLLTGITEVLITWLILRNTNFGQRIWKEILSFSLGFGAIEAIILGAASLFSMIVTLTMIDQIPVSQLRTVAVANHVLYDLAPILERIFTIGIHLGCNVLLFYGVMKKETRWFWYSFALKSGIDTVAGYAQLSGQLQSMGFLWIIELVVVLFGLVGFWVAKYLKPKILAIETEPIIENIQP
jgi:uncharacterized membrane protein YhfC